MRAFRFTAAAGLVLAAAACSDQVTPSSVTTSEPSQLAPIYHAPAGRGIDGSYIVVLKDGASPEQVAQELGLKAEQSYRHALVGFALPASDAQLASIRRHRAVKYVEQNMIARISTTQTGATWGLDRIDQRALPLAGTYIYTPTGSGVRAYIVDTGIRTAHTNFGGRASVGYDAVGDGQNGQDCEGHGTHVAGTVGSTTYGVAKSVSLIAVRVLDCTGNGSYTDIIEGLDWVVANHVKPAVVNMSLGGPASTALDDAVRRVHNAGVTIAVAAGNESENACTESPSRVTAEALVVGSTTSTDARSSFSDYGSCVDLFAPGSSITSLGISSNTATAGNSGTSMASPHVAGVAALYLQGAPSATPSAVHAAIINSATCGKVTSAGTGSPNKLLNSTLSTTGNLCGVTGTTFTYTGSLSGTGVSSYQPSTSGYASSVSGTHSATLSGTGVDFDLYLQKLSGSTWSNVASSLGTTSSESVSYSGTAGTYRWRVYSYSGSGTWTLVTTRP
jgi:subtilisin family serine protease